jgi:predicted RNase H-like nuclease (RuvC/YqgF family)
MGDHQPGKAAKAHVYGTPLVALIMAIAGYLSNKSEAGDAASKADREADEARIEAKRFADYRLRTAYDAMQEALESQAQRIEDLESWIVELEGFVEEHVEEDSPRTSREREARDRRLAEIRASKARRERTRFFKPAAAGAMPDYDVVQSTEDFDHLPPDFKPE